jgi:hypothetical protein
LSVQQAVVAGAALDQFAKARPVAPVVGGAIVAPEQVHEIALKRRRPIDPAIGEGAFGSVRRPQGPAAVSGTEVADDVVGFPHHEPGIVDDGNAPMRIDGEECGGVQSSECAADIDALMGQPELCDHPHHLLHVERTAASPHFEH